MEDSLANKYRRVVSNGKDFKWATVNAWVPQGSILGSLFFLVYINDLSNELSSNPRLSPDDASLFSVARDTNLSVIIY